MGHSSGSSLIRSLLLLAPSILSPSHYGNVILLGDPMYYSEQSFEASSIVSENVLNMLGCADGLRCQIDEKKLLKIQENVVRSDLATKWTGGEIPATIPFAPSIDHELIQETFFDALSNPNSTLSDNLRSKKLWVNFLSHETAPSISLIFPSSSVSRASLSGFLIQQLGEEGASGLGAAMDLLREADIEGSKDLIRNTLTDVGTSLIYACPALSLLSLPSTSVTVSENRLSSSASRYSTNKNNAFCEGKSCHSDELSDLFSRSEGAWQDSLKRFVWGYRQEAGARRYSDESIELVELEEMKEKWGCSKWL